MMRKNAEVSLRLESLKKNRTIRRELGICYQNRKVFMLVRTLFVVMPIEAADVIFKTIKKSRAFQASSFPCSGNQF